MTPFEMAKAYRASLLTCAGAIIVNGNDKEYYVEKIRSMSHDMRTSGRGIEAVDPNDLTEQELTELGFHLWSKELPIKLIPLWFLSFMKHGSKIICINGKEELFDPNTCDTDHRGGLTAYGVYPKKEG